MDHRTPTGLIARRDYLLREIDLYRPAVREHVLVALGHGSRAGHQAAQTLRAVSLAPALATFVSGLMRRRRPVERRHGGDSGKLNVRGLISVALSGYALWKVFKGA